MPQTEHPNPGCGAWLRTVGRLQLVCAVVSGVIAVFSIAAWGLGNWRLATVARESIPIAPSTALLFLLLSLALMAEKVAVFRHRANRIKVAAAGITVIAAFGAALPALADIPLPWEDWLARTDVTVRGIPVGQMSPITAGIFLLAAFSLIAITPPWAARPLLRRAGKISALLGGGFCAITALAYGTGTPLFYGGQLVPMALLTAIAFVALNLALLLSSRADMTVHDLFFGSAVGPVVPGPSAREKRLILGLGSLVLLAVALASFWLLRSEQAKQRSRIHRELIAIAELKVSQVAAWRDDQLRSARLLMRTPELGRRVSALAGNPPARELSADLIAWMQEVKALQQYESIVLLDREAKPLLATPPAAALSDPPSQTLLRKLAGARDVIEGCLHRSTTGAIQADWLVPVFDAGQPDPVGAVLLRADPERNLYPLLRDWPVPSETAETLLVETDGEEIVFLNQPRHTPDVVLTRQERGTPRFLAARIAGGETGLIDEGVDYRGVAVVGVGRPVPGTSWFLVAKVDQVEAFAPLRQEGWKIGTLTLSRLMVVALCAGLLWRHRSAEILRREFTAEKEREALATRLAIVMEQANDAILLMDEEGRILEANQRMLTTYGYTLDELRALPPGGLRAPGGEVSLAQQLELYEAPAGAVFEALHQRRDGAQFFVEISGRTFAVDGRPLKLGVIRDISERKASELEIARLNRLYAALSQINQAIVHLRSREDLFRQVCRILVESGQFKMAWIGWHDTATRLIRPVASHGDVNESLTAIRVYADDRPEGRGPTGTALRETRTCVCLDITTDPATASWRELAAQHGFFSSIALPIRVEGKASGVLTVYAGRKNAFTDQEVALLEEASTDVSFALAQLERDERRRHAEAAMRESETRYRSLFANMVEGFAYCQMRYENGQPVDFVYLEVNEAFSRLTGLKAVIGRNASEVIPGIRTSDPELLERYGRVARSGAPERFEMFVSALSMWFDIAVYCPRDGYFVAVFDVITARKEASEALRLAHLRLRRIVDSNIVGIAIAGANGSILEANDYYLRLIGFTREEFERGEVDWRALTPPEWSPADNQAIRELREHGTCRPYEKEYQRRDGTRVPVFLADALLPGPDEQIAAVALDLTERKANERRLREQAEVLDKANEAIVIGDLANRIVFWNPGAERLFGWTAAEIVGRPVNDVFAGTHDARRRQFDAAVASNSDWRGEIDCRNRRGDPLVIEISVTVLRDAGGQVTGRLTISTDVTEKKSLAEQFLRAQRVENIGTLAAGIAHDLNNVLAPIIMATGLLRSRFLGSDDLHLIDTLEKCAKRGAGLVRQILGFARGIGGETRLMQVKHLIRDVAEVVAETFPKSIVLDEHIPNDLWPIEANPTQIQQVLLNLCVNARDAMPGGGTLRLRAENCVLDAASARQIDGATPGAWLVLHVEDTGMGIAPELLNRIWQPFFTTKSVGEGTGLGLSTVRGIVETHRGFIALESRVGHGTTFRVHFPAVADTTPLAPDADATPVARGHDELILLVDDEAPIRETAGKMLIRSGYRVVSAADGVQAAALFVARAAEFALVITDRDMPGVGGAELAHFIRVQRPEVKILAMSGLSHSHPRSDEKRDGFGDAFLAKPFTVETLLNSVGELLQDKSQFPLISSRHGQHIDHR